VVSRAALIERLRGDDTDIVAVTAPPGYGKTTMLAEWVSSDERRCAWLSLDARDNDPVVLLTYVAAALDMIERVDPGFVPALWTPGASLTTEALPRFARLVAGRDMPFVLVLDDVHELVNPEAMDVLAVIVAALPPDSVFALAGRVLPPLPFGRLRVKRGLVEVGQRDLAMDAIEAAAMFRASDLDLDDDAVATLVERTEGWPAGLYLAIRSLRRDRGDLAGSVARFAGDNRLVADYLRDELLTGLSPEDETFLLEASCLEQLSGQLCDAVLERSGSAALLDELEHRSLLIIPLDEQHEWYRLHNLLTDALQAELARRHPGVAIEIHRRASAWFEANGDIDAATTHAWRGGDLERAEHLIYSHVGLYTGQGRHATILRWLSLFTPDELRTKPLLAAIVAQSRITAGDGDGAAQWLGRAEAGVPDRHPPDARGWVPPVAVALLRAMVGRLSATQMADEAEYAYRRLDHGAWRAMAGVLLGSAEFMLGNEGTAEDLLSEAVAEAADTPTVQGLGLAHLALLAVERGRWDEASRLAREGRSLLTTHGLDALPTQFLVTASSCLVEARASRIAEAEADRTLTRRSMMEFSRIGPWANLQARIALVRADLILGDRVGARTRLDEADAFLLQVPDAIRVKEQVAQLRRELAAQAGSDSFGPSSLTVAELRVVTYLPTHLTLAEIADRLFVSRNTVKTQAIAIYRKLGTSSRAGAVAVARDAGLLDGALRTG
jgi:LuxR family maltose regulon positive regulatory protein